MALSLLAEGALFGSLNVIGMILLEFGLSMKDVKLLHKREAGRELHISGIAATAFNSIVLGSITYAVTVEYFCVKGPLALFQQACSVMVFLLVENVMYYFAHMAMHTRKLYWMHRFHHKFNVVVLPSSASAVSIPEFVIAYMAPFVVGSWVAGTDKSSAVVAASIVAISNLVIHTPALEEAMSHLPWMFVTPSDHFAHHRQLTCNYGAPLFSLDRILNVMKDFMFLFSSSSDDEMESVPFSVGASFCNSNPSLDGEDSDEYEETEVETKKEL